MGMTLTEKILARGAGLPEVRPGQIVNCRIDLAMIQDALGPIVYTEYEKIGRPIWDPERVFVVIDHNCLPGTLENAVTVDRSEKFAREHHLRHLCNMQGVAHQLIVESGKLTPGMLAVGTDSHTCTYGALGVFSTGIGSTEMCAVLALGQLWFKVPETIRVRVTGRLPERVLSKDIILKLLATIGANGATYRSLEFTGDTISALSMDARFTLCNMAIEAGGKNGIIAPDSKTEAFLRETGADMSLYEPLSADADAVYAQSVELDASRLCPQVSKPFSPANAVDVTELEGLPLNQIIIGACTNGRLEDLQIAAQMLRGRQVNRELRCYVVPASNRVYAEASRLGLLGQLADAGCIIVNPGCGGCGIQMPMTAGQVCLGTHNRNFKGRMGHPDSLVYLASPATAAASALTGKITDPRTQV